MRSLNPLALAACLVTVGCSMSSSDTVKIMAPERAKQSYVSDIVIKSVPGNTSPEFTDKLRNALQDHLKQCARGTQPLKLEVSIALFSPQNAALTILIGDSNKIKGTARFVDPVSGAVVGDYDVARSIGWGGIGAAVIMAYGEAEMSDAFADEVCQRAFTPAN